MKVILGLSGGVDSAVSAYLLKEQGYEVIGVFMKNWDETTGLISGDCPWKQDRLDAMKVAAFLDIPFHTYDFSKEYEEEIVNYIFSEYEKGRTPNPDVLCNPRIKFPMLWKVAKELGAEKIATGHYVQRSEIRNQRSERLELGVMESELRGEGTIYQLLAGKDSSKDQSYFLCQLTQEDLSRSLFPIGHLLKSEVREIAQKIGLPNAEKKDSQGLCFIGKVDLPTFLQQKLPTKEGPIVLIPPTFDLQSLHSQTSDLRLQTLGVHHGAWFFTIGQRKGLDVGGTKQGLYVLGTDVKTNTVYVGEGEDHPGLFKKTLHVAKDDIHWIREDIKMEVGEEREYLVRIRYRQPLQKATLEMTSEGLNIHFDEPQRAVTAGQFAAWYDGEELLGSGVIYLI